MNRERWTKVEFVVLLVLVLLGVAKAVRFAWRTLAALY